MNKKVTINETILESKRKTNDRLWNRSRSIELNISENGKV
jgi:hypothetical protein